MRLKTVLASLAVVTSWSGAAHAAGPLHVRVDALRVLRDRSLPSFGVTVTAVNTGPEDDAVLVREVRLLDREGQVRQRARLEARLAGLGGDWKTLEPLLPLEHDEVSLHLEPEEAIRLFTKAEGSSVEVTLPFETRAFVGEFRPGTRATARVEVEYEWQGRLASVVDEL